MPVNPYTFQNLEDVADSIDLVTAENLNNVRESQRYLKEGLEHKDQASAIYGANGRDLVKSGHDLDNCFLKSAHPLFFVSKLDANPAQSFQNHCLTNRGYYKHIIVDPNVQLGQCDDLINSNTLIEGAFFDDVSGTHKRLDISGVSDINVTVAGTGNPYTITGIRAAQSLLTKKINIGDIVYVKDGASIAYGEVASIVSASSCTVNFYLAPPAGPSLDEIIIFKKNITFIGCKFFSQVHILNTWGTKFLNCEFVASILDAYPNPTTLKAGGIFANVRYYGDQGGGGGISGETRLPLIRECAFLHETDPSNRTCNPSGIIADIVIDKAALAVIEGNIFFGFPASINISRAPISANNIFPRVCGGCITENNVQKYLMTVINMQAGANYVANLYFERNVRDLGVW